MKSALTCTCVVGLVFACAPSTRGFEGREQTKALWSVERNLIALTNRQRRKHRLPPLQIDSRLIDSARQHAFWMSRSGGLQHTNRAVGENIAMGQRSSAEAVRDWMQSPGHRANILSGQYRRVGAAAYRTPQGTIYWCLQFLR